MPPIHITCFKDQPKKHPQQESGIHPQRVQSRDAWASSRSQEPHGATPAAAPPHHLLLALPGDHQDKSLILSGRAQVRRAQSKTAPARKGTQIGLVAPDSMWSLSEETCLFISTTHVVFKHSSSLMRLCVACVFVCQQTLREWTLPGQLLCVCPSFTSTSLPQKHYFLSNNYAKIFEASYNSLPFK